jgi:hypothetical protein
MYSRKIPSVGSPLMSIFMLCMALTGSLIIPLYSPKAYAAPVKNDPLVTVVVDKTLDGSCTEIFRANIETHQSSVTQIPCPAGTIMSYSNIRQSQAIAQHKLYVVMPSSQASLTLRQQYATQIQKLREIEQALLQSQISTSIHPATACGGDGSASLYWYPNAPASGELYSSISFYKSSDCSSAYFEDSVVNVVSILYYYANWVSDKYASNTWGVPGCPVLYDVGHHFHLISQSAPVKYYFENQIYTETNACNPTFLVWDNIGPIN